MTPGTVAYLSQRPGVTSRGTLEARFSKKLVKRGENDCWPWVGAKSEKGYGHFFVGGKTKPAHRVAYAMAFGDMPEGMHVLHRCDNPSCVNPAHLFLGTNSDNVADRVAKGRSGRGEKMNGLGEKNGSAKLRIDQVLEIKAAAGLSLKALGQKYGVSKSAVCHIRTGKKWSRAIEAATSGGGR